MKHSHICSDKNLINIAPLASNLHSNDPYLVGLLHNEWKKELKINKEIRKTIINRRTVSVIFCGNSETKSMLKINLLPKKYEFEPQIFGTYFFKFLRMFPKQLSRA